MAEPREANFLSIWMGLFTPPSIEDWRKYAEVFTPPGAFGFGMAVVQGCSQAGMNLFDEHARIAAGKIPEQRRRHAH